VASTYTRPHASVPDQLALLKTRGLTIQDEPEAHAWLMRLGYYRLSAYWYPFRQRQFLQAAPSAPITTTVLDQFVAGANFDAALDLYHFDKQLRLLVLDAIEQVEVAARVDIAHSLGRADTFAQTNPSLLDGNFVAPRPGGAPSKHADWLHKLDQCTDRSKEEFVAHYKTRYGQPLPIWVSIEVWDFGLVSFFASGMKPVDRIAMANRFGVSNAVVFMSWLRSINYLRNLAAHHSRVWNRNIVDQPKLPRPGDIAMFTPALGDLNPARVYSLLCILAFLLRTIRPATDWHTRMAEHLAAFPVPGVAGVDAADLGCPAGWQAHAFWN
jgi:abortive infection bacteriophage resistance protein